MPRHNTFTTMPTKRHRTATENTKSARYYLPFNSAVARESIAHFASLAFDTSRAASYPHNEHPMLYRTSRVAFLLRQQPKGPTIFTWSSTIYCRRVHVQKRYCAPSRPDSADLHSRLCRRIVLQEQIFLVGCRDSITYCGPVAYCRIGALRLLILVELFGNTGDSKNGKHSYRNNRKRRLFSSSSRGCSMEFVGCCRNPHNDNMLYKRAG
jgi:hypothetical protein